MDACPGNPDVRREELVIVPSNGEGSGDGLWCPFFEDNDGFEYNPNTYVILSCAKTHLEFGHCIDRSKIPALYLSGPKTRQKKESPPTGK